MLSALKNYFQEFKVLKDCPRRYWASQVVNFLDSMEYFMLMIVITLFLSNEFSFSDEGAGYVMTVLGITVSISLLFAGAITDWLGIRMSLYLSMGMKLVLMAALSAMSFIDLPYKHEIVTTLFGVLGVSMSVAKTAFQSANKRFTSKQARAAGFSLWYLFMNVGAFFAGLVVDLLRQIMHLPNVYILMAGVLFSVVCMVVIRFYIDSDDQVYGEGEELETETGTKENPFQIFWAVVKDKVFWQLMVLLTLLLGVRSAFLYVSILMPKYWVRVMGPEAAIGTLNSINPFIVIIGIIFFIPIAKKLNVFKALTLGALVSSISILVLALPWSWFGGDMVNSYYAMSVISMVVLALGEIFWSPRLMEYTAAIAPKGREGAYLGFSSLTWFGSKTIVSALSGHMLTRWVPEKIDETPLQDVIKAGQLSFWDTPEAMWFWLGLWAVGGVVITMMLKGWFTKGADWNRQH